MTHPVLFGWLCYGAGLLTAWLVTFQLQAFALRKSALARAAVLRWIARLDLPLTLAEAQRAHDEVCPCGVAVIVAAPDLDEEILP